MSQSTNLLAQGGFKLRKWCSNERGVSTLHPLPFRSIHSVSFFGGQEFWYSTDCTVQLYHLASDKN